MSGAGKAASASVMPDAAPSCGSRAAYQRGCRCLPCRAANARYAAARACRPNPLVDAGEARAHLVALGKHRRGRVGYRRAAKLSGLSFQLLRDIRKGIVLQIRTSTEARILAIRHKPAPGLLINSYDARHLIAVLVNEGFSLPQLAKALRFDLVWLERYAQPVALAPRYISCWRAAHIRRFFEQITAEGSDLPVAYTPSWDESVHAESRRFSRSRSSWRLVEAASPADNADFLT